MPGKVEPLVENCLYGMINNIPWNVLGKNCHLSHVAEPEKFIKVIESHLIYFKAEKDLITLFCPEGLSQPKTKTITLSGAGILTIPTGCRVTYDGDKKNCIPWIHKP